MSAGVRRQGFWNQWALKLRESLAHLFGLIMRRAGGDASVARQLRQTKQRIVRPAPLRPSQIQAATEPQVPPRQPRLRRQRIERMRLA